MKLSNITYEERFNIILAAYYLSECLKSELVWISDTNLLFGIHYPNTKSDKHVLLFDITVNIKQIILAWFK